VTVVGWLLELGLKHGGGYHLRVGSPKGSG
jgi:hypothetical protein